MKRVRPWLDRLSLLCAGLVVGAAANAGNIRGNWDPQFNNTFTGVGFRGTIGFFVPDPCLGGTPGTTVYIADVDGCSGSGMYLIDAEVILYQDPNPNNIQSTITFAPPVQLPDPILGILVEYDATTGAPSVIGLDTLPMGPQLSDQNNGSFPLPEGFPANLYLQLSSGDPLSPVEQLPVGGAYLLPRSCTGVEFPSCSPVYTEDIRSNRAEVTFVPEPGSLALLLSAMGVGWLARRRTAAR